MYYCTQRQKRLWCHVTSLAVFEKCLISTVKQNGGNVMVWDELHFTNWISNTENHSQVWVEELCSSISKIFPQEDIEFLKKQKIKKILDWPSILPDFNPIKHLLDVLRERDRERDGKRGRERDGERERKIERVEKWQLSRKKDLKYCQQSRWKNTPVPICANTVRSVLLRQEAVK